MRLQDDPSFVRVDRDQLAAVCLAQRLPPSSYPSDYGALVLADGSRVPWLTVWVDERYAKATSKPLVLANAWKKSALDVIEGGTKGPPKEQKPTPGKIIWMNELCADGNAADVAITGVFFQKDGFHALAIRGDDIRSARMPVSTPRDAVFRKAFELTDELLGGKREAKIATHVLGGGNALATVTTSVWVKAAGS